MDKNTNRKTARQHRPVKKTRRTENVYTEAKPVNITRFLVRIATVVAVVMAVVLGMSIFFKTERIEIAGADKYTIAQIEEASKIMKGSNLLTLNKAQIAGRILKELPYISEIRIGIRLPDTVVIEVKESAVAYAAQSGDNGWWLISCEGKVLEKIDASVSQSNARMIGVRLESPKIGEKAVALEEAPQGETPVTVYARERLAAALEIAKEMEKNGVLGALATIDVTEMGDIEVWYGQRFRILLGGHNDIPMKVFHVVDVINNRMTPYEKGILDASFTTYPGEVYHKSFD